MRTIPYGRQWIDDEDIKEVEKVLKSDYITQGPKVKEFEESVCDYTGARYAVAFNSGTSALHGAMFAAGVKEEAEVITSPITFVATSNAAMYLGGIPRFVDIDPRTYCIDIEKIEEKITAKTKVIAPVDYAGYPVNMKQIREIADKYNLMIVEDAAHALGAKRYGKKMGEEADLTVLSFHPVKLITTGEGGMVLTNDEELYYKLRLFHTHGITKDKRFLEKKGVGPWYYEMQMLGFNYRLTDIQCALGISQMKKLERFVKRRNEIAQRYDEAFSDHEDIKIPPKPEYPSSRHAYHLYPIRIKGKNRKMIFEALRKRGIWVQVHYIPVPAQPYYRKRFGYENGAFPNAEKFYEEEISIPMYPKILDEQIEYVINSLKEVLRSL